MPHCLNIITPTGGPDLDKTGTCGKSLGKIQVKRSLNRQTPIKPSNFGRAEVFKTWVLDPAGGPKAPETSRALQQLSMCGGGPPRVLPARDRWHAGQNQEERRSQPFGAATDDRLQTRMEGKRPPVTTLRLSR